MRKIILTIVLLSLTGILSRGSPATNTATSLITGIDANIVSNNNLPNSPDMELVVIEKDNYALYLTDNDIILSTNSLNDGRADVDASKIRYSRDIKSHCFVQPPAVLGGADKTVVNSVVKSPPAARYSVIVSNNNLLSLVAIGNYSHSSKNKRAMIQNQPTAVLGGADIKKISTLIKTLPADNC